MVLGFGGQSSQLATYFTEVSEHFATLTDPEEKALLAANAVEEAAGQELEAATSPATAFTLEKLLAAAELPTVLAFLRAVLETQDAFGSLATNKTGSHILEKILQKLGDEAPDADATTQTAVQQMLGRVCAAVVDNLGDCITDRCGSHVARRLLSVAAGRPVGPAAARKPKSELFEDEDAPTEQPQAAGGQNAGLAARLAARPSAPESATAPYPGVTATLTEAVLHPDNAAHMADMAYHTHASPWLQALVKANSGNRATLEPLVACLLGGADAGSVDGVRPQAVHDMMEDRTGSHVLEAVLAAASDELYGRLFARFFAGSLLTLAMQPIANFVVQAALSAARTGDQIKAALAELGDGFDQLLSRRRAGVVAALLAAAGRLGAGQSEACRALSRGLTALPAASVERRGLAVALMTLDGAGQLGADAPEEAVPAKHRTRLSAPGCAMLALLLRFPLDASQKFTKAVALLTPGDAAAVGIDPGGTRVLEAFIEGHASAKQKKALVRALGGSWAALAAEFGGSHLVMKCFDFAGVADKEAIVQELVGARRTLYASPRGTAVLRHTGGDVYARSPAEWRQRSATAAAVRSDFAAMLGDDAPAQPRGGGGGAGAGGAGSVEEDAVAASAAGAAQDGGGTKAKKAKRRAAAADDVAAEQAGAGQPAPDKPKKKKKRRAVEEAAEEAAPQDSSAAGSVGEAKRKKHKHGLVAPDSSSTQAQKPGKTKKPRKSLEPGSALGGQRTTDMMQLLVG